MARVKRGILKTKKRTAILKEAKGFKWGRKNRKKAAEEALLHASGHAYVGRKQKKKDFRQLWQVRLNAALKEDNLKYSDFINKLKKSNILLNRKVLSELANQEPAIFNQILKEIKIKL